MYKLPRSLRNNNPFNIKKSSSSWLGKLSSSRWPGQVKGDDNVFESFDTLEHGTRAGLKLLFNYVKKGYNTPRKIINRFAPSSENDTKSYLRFVSDSHVLPPDEVIDNLGNFILFCERIIEYESGLSFKQLHDYGISLSYLFNIISKYNLNFLYYEED